MFKVSVDIDNLIYKLPLKYGWKRELVFKKMIPIHDGVVYYYSPDNQKLRTLAQIKRLLDTNDYGPLTIKHFTFIKKPVTISYLPDEFVENAVDIWKVKPSVELLIKSKEEKKLPLQQIFSHNNQNENSSNGIQINLNHGQKSTTDKFDAINLSSIKHEDRPENLEITQNYSRVKVSCSTNTDYIKINTSNNKERKVKIIDKYRKTAGVFENFENLESMIHVFKYLKTRDLLSASRVCTSWNLIAMKSIFWQNICLNYSMVYNWDKCIDTVVKKSTVSLDIRSMLIPMEMSKYNQFWLQFNTAIVRAKQLKVIKLCKCPSFVVENIISTLPQLETLTVTSIGNPCLTQKSRDKTLIHLKNLDQMKNLTVLKLQGLTEIQFASFPSLMNLVNLKTLSLTSVKKFPRNINSFLGTVTTDLEILEIGDCQFLSENFAISLKKFLNLRSLRLENCFKGLNNYSPEVFSVIKSFKKLKILELINIEVTEFVRDGLKNCHGINSLLIIPDYRKQAAVTNTYIIECLINLSKTLTHAVWGITVELLQSMDKLIYEYKNILPGPIDSDCKVPFLHFFLVRKSHLALLSGELPLTVKIDENGDVSIDLIPFGKLERLLAKKLVNAKTNLIKVPFLATTEIYLENYFNDI